MPFPIESRLVIAVAASAVFDLTEADTIFRSEGEHAYRTFQISNLDVPFTRGVAFPFIKRLLLLNRRYPKLEPVEVVVLSRNDPESGNRFFRSCRHYDLDITRGAFLTGKDPYPYIPAFNASLFLSANANDVKSAIGQNMPAGLVLPSTATDDEHDELRVAFDFDGVIIDDEAETVYKETGNLDLFHQSESSKVDLPHRLGPLGDLVQKLSNFQKYEHKLREKDPDHYPSLRVAIVTARNAPSNERMVHTLKQLGLDAVEVFFMGGIEKNRVLKVLKPHIFFDDQMDHLEPAASSVPSVHIPFGIANI